MVYDAARKEVVVFGGSQPGGSDWDDTWTWDGTTWTQKFPTTSPPGRQFHAMAYDAARGQVVIFGGGSIIDLFAPKNDTWLWAGTNWTQVPGTLASTSSRPKPKYRPISRLLKILQTGSPYHALYRKP